jgi:hypothetical protein
MDSTIFITAQALLTPFREVRSNLQPQQIPVLAGNVVEIHGECCAISR